MAELELQRAPGERAEAAAIAQRLNAWLDEGEIAESEHREGLGRALRSVLTSGDREEEQHEGDDLPADDEQQQIVATLTRQQQQRWVALLGERIDVSKLPFDPAEVSAHELPWTASDE